MRRLRHRGVTWRACSVVSDSLQPHGLQPTRLPSPWDSPGKNTGVGCHFLLQCMKVKTESEVAQSCPTLWDPMDVAYQAPPSMGFSRLEYWSGLQFPTPGYLPNPRNRTSVSWVSCIGRQILDNCSTWGPCCFSVESLRNLTSLCLNLLVCKIEIATVSIQWCVGKHLTTGPWGRGWEG